MLCFILACTVHRHAEPDTESYKNIVIDEEFARKKGCAMPELVNLLDDPDVLQHLKVSHVLMLEVCGFASSFNCQIFNLKLKCNIVLCSLVKLLYDTDLFCFVAVLELVFLCVFLSVISVLKIMVFLCILKKLNC